MASEAMKKLDQDVATSSAVLIGISGASRSGKSSLAFRLQSVLHPRVVTLVQQDEDRFWRHSALLAAAAGSKWEELGNWEVPEAVDHPAFAVAVTKAMAKPDVAVVICEGFQAFHNEVLMAQMALRLWIHVSEGTARARRMATSPVPPAYFEECIWPCHCEYRARVLPPSSLLHCHSRAAVGNASALIFAEDSDLSCSSSALVCLDGEAAADDVFAEALTHVHRTLGEA